MLTMRCLGCVHKQVQKAEGKKARCENLLKADSKEQIDKLMHKTWAQTIKYGVEQLEFSVPVLHAGLQRYRVVDLGICRSTYARNI